METTKLNYNKKTKVALIVSRVAGVLAFLALMSAWVSEFNENILFGLSTQHYFNDAIVLSLWSIAGLLDAYLHSKNLK
jgi:hypothetical protein